MKYYTREILNSMINSELDYNAWDKVIEQYQEHYKNIEIKLNKSIRDFSKKSLHDCRVLGYEKLDNDIISIKIDGKTGIDEDLDCKFTLAFKEVKYAQGLENITKEYCVWTEVHLSDIANFEYRMLLDYNEFIIVANEVVFEECK